MIVVASLLERMIPFESPFFKNSCATFLFQPAMAYAFPVSTHEVGHSAKYDISLYIPVSILYEGESDNDEP